MTAKATKAEKSLKSVVLFRFDFEMRGGKKKRKKKSFENWKNKINE